MSTTKNLLGPDAVQKLRDLTKTTSTCMFASGLSKVPFHVCPMGVQEVDDSGNLWFFSGADSVHNRQLEGDPRAQLIFSNQSKVEYLTVFGETIISKDPGKIAQLWTKMAEAWFPEGKDDPNLTLLCVNPSLAHYWNTENGKLVTMAKILTAAVTGAEIDEGGVEGDLRV